ncbi:MAG: ABC transporter permease [Polyangiaceae bacterium]|nr:ABC transporter permease [Polyangiaceae bacterium]
MRARLLAASVAMAVASLGRSRLRTALTALGILIGIAAVVVVTALGTGARESIGGQIDSLGANLLFIFGQARVQSGARTGGTEGLTERDAAALRREAPALERASVYSGVVTQVISEFGNARIGVMGVDLPYFPVRGYDIEAGRAWTEGEELIKSKVCVIGRTASTKLFGSVDPVGRWVRIGRNAFRVIGTLVPKGQSPFEDQDDRVLVPIGAWRSRVSPTGGDRVQLIVASTRGAAWDDAAVRQVDGLLRQRHRIPEGAEPDFRVRTQAEFRAQQDAILGVVTLLLVSVAGIALFVGGVGVMNIMLVSVTERTREIGIRMAVGARHADVSLQFLLEAIALTLFGGVLGIALATGIIELLKRSLGWSMRLSAEAVGVALATSVAVGLVFGFLPARRAAALDPIEALRHE